MQEHGKMIAGALDANQTLVILTGVNLLQVCYSSQYLTSEQS